MDYPEPLGTLNELQGSLQPQLGKIAKAGVCYCQIAGIPSSAVRIAILPRKVPLAAVQKWLPDGWLMHISSTLLATDYGKATEFAMAHELGHIINHDCERSPEEFIDAFSIEHKANVTGIGILTKAYDLDYALEAFTAACRLSHSLNTRMSEYRKRSALVDKMKQELKLAKLDW